MKGFLFSLIGLVLVSLGCENSNGEAVGSSDVQDSVQQINLNEIELNTTPLHELSDSQIAAVTTIYETFEAVNPNTLDEWISGFELDLNPDREIGVWLNMASAYSEFTTNNVLSLDQKMEVYTIVLLRSLMPNEEVVEKHQTKYLTVEQVKEILSYYTEEPKPIRVI